MSKARETSLAIPAIPTLNELQASDSPKRIMDDYAESVRETMASNEQIFRKDLKFMKLCGYLRGALGRKSHFSWCPHDLWAEYWREPGFTSMDHEN